jgi:hypothetical protein
MITAGRTVADTTDHGEAREIARREEAKDDGLWASTLYEKVSA